MKIHGPLAAACLLASVGLSPASGAPGEDVVSWRFGSFDRVLAQAEREQKSVLVYFWVPSSDTCTRMYGETLQDSKAGDATSAFLCYSASSAEQQHAYPLFERYGITTVPTIRVVRPDGAADDGLDGFADIDTLSSQLGRIARGEGTLSDLLRQTEENPDDLDLRNSLAGKYLDLGDRSKHDALQESIKEDDPEGKSLIAAQLRFGDVVKEAIGKAGAPDQMDIGPLARYADSVTHEQVVFGTWDQIASVENARGDMAGELAAYRRAWATIPDARVLNWGHRTAEWLWHNRDELSKEDKAFALELAQLSAERAELLREGGDDGYGNAYSGDDFDSFLAARLCTLSKCLYMNGKRKDALEVAERCRELDPESKEYARRAEVYGAREDDGEFHAYQDVRPVWSPDGGKILFTSNRHGNDELYTADVKRGKLRRLTRYQGNESSSAWSPDGKTVAFNSDRFLTGGIYTMKPNGSGEKILLPFDPTTPVTVSDPAWSPDGKRIAFATMKNGKSEIAVMAADGTGERVLTADTPKTDMQPTWSPDGERILFMSNRAGDSDVWCVPADGGEEVNITNAPKDSWDMDPELSPDGERIVFSSWRSGQLEVYVMNADGTGVENLTQSPTQDRHPRWSPDGRRIAFDRTLEDGSTRVWLMNANGSNPKPLLEE